MLEVVFDSWDFWEKQNFQFSMSKYRSLVPLIKDPLKTPYKPPQRILNFARKIPQILKSPNSQRILYDHVSQFESYIPSIISQIPDPNAALAFFNSISLFHDGESCSALVVNLSKSNLLQEIESILESTRTLQITLTDEAYSAVLGLYCRAGLDGKAIDFFHSVREKTKCLPKVVDCNYFLKLLVDKGKFEFAKKVYDEMIKRDVVDSFSTCIMARGLCMENKMNAAKNLIKKRFGAGCVPNVVFYNTLMDGYFRNGQVKKGYLIFREMELKGFLPTLVSYCILIKGFVSNGFFCDVGKFFNEMKARGMKVNVEIHNNVVDAFCKQGLIREAKAVFRIMTFDCCGFDIVTFNTIISGLCKLGKVVEGEKFLREAIRRKLTPDNMSYTPLIHEYCKQGEVFIASNLILEMMNCGFKPDLVTYGALIHGLVVIGEINEAMRVKDKMIEKGVYPDANIYNVLINGFFKKGMLSSAKTLVSEMLDQNIILDVYVYSSLIDGYVRNNDIDEANNVFEFMEQKRIKYGVVTYNAMIKGYCKNGMVSTAISYMNKMRTDGLRPDEYTYTTIVDGYVKLCDTNGALSVFCDMIKRKCMPNVVTYTALISGFCKTREFVRAETLFNEMKACNVVPNVVTYTILIGNHSKDRNITKAIQFFEEMLQKKCAPNDVTFNYLVNGLKASISTLGAFNEFELLNIFTKMVTDGWDCRTAAYNSIIFSLCNHQMIDNGVELRDKMIQKGCLPDSITFLCLLHGLCLCGKSQEWKNVLTSDFKHHELEIALTYANRHINQGVRSEVLSILQSIVDNRSNVPKVEAVTYC